MTGTRQLPKKLTTSHLSKIADLKKRDAHMGEMALFYAWKILHLESLSLGLRLEHKQLAPQQKAALASIKARLLNCLGYGPKPEGILEFHGLVPLHARRGLSVFCLPQAQQGNYPNHFSLFIDPGEDLDLLLKKVRKEIIAERERRGITNASGQGKPMGIQRRLKALEVYKKSIRAKQRHNNSPNKWWAAIPGINNENTAHKLTCLAKQMVKSAMNQTWEKAVPLR